MIYIDTAPTKCYERFKKRDRRAETSHITSPDEEAKFAAYLVSLHDAHQRMIETFRTEHGKDSVLVIDANMDIVCMEEYDRMVAQFKCDTLCCEV